MISRRGAQDGEGFRARPGAPRARSGPESKRFVAQVLKAVSKSGAKASGVKGARPASTFGRGRVAAGVMGSKLGANARRVVIKSRFVVLKKAGAQAVATHLRYIEREGTTRDGQRGQAYGADTDTADLRDFEERGRGDRHQFRFIVSVEDAAELEDLRGYTRELMARMEVDLETRLDWVAVDHWDTDNPHTHVVLRGKVGQGRGARDLVIAPDYMAHGMRLRANALANEWLGPRTELEMRQSLLREVAQERFTSLDRTLLRQAAVSVVHLTAEQGVATDKLLRYSMLRSRLQHLEAMALAERIDVTHWRLVPGMEQTLKILGERGDILKAVHRAIKGERRELIADASLSIPVVGRIAAKGLSDELHDSGYLVVDGIDGRAYYLKLATAADLAGLPIDGIVEVQPPGRERSVDCTIAVVAPGGIYNAKHLVRRKETADSNSQSSNDPNMRRLNALHRAGIMVRVADGFCEIAPNLAPPAQRHEAWKLNGPTITLRSHLSVNHQVRTLGATWLDERLICGGQGLGNQGFGREARKALLERADFLAEQGLAERLGARVMLAPNLLAALRHRELVQAAQSIAAETGLAHRLVPDGQQVTGIYQRRVTLASGQYAMLGDGQEFCLVPWRPVIRQRLGQQIVATVRGDSVMWESGKSLGKSL